jgi:hypothetical protein
MMFSCNKHCVLYSAALFPKLHVKSGSGTKSITICSQAGKPISSIPWEGGNLIGMGWNSNEDLICILEEGTMAAYSMHGFLHYSRLISRVSFWHHLRI